MTPLALAWRSLTRQPARAVLGIAGVAVVGALLFDMLLLSNGLQVSFRQLLDSVGFDVRVTATDALPGSGPMIPGGAATLRELTRLEELSEVVGFRFGRAEATAQSGEEIRFEWIGVTGSARNTWTILEGHDLDPAPHPEALPGVVVNRGLATLLDVAPGDVVPLRGACAGGDSALPLTRVRVIGIAEFRFEDRDGRTVLSTLDVLERACDVEDSGALDLLVAASAADVASAAAVEAVRRLRPELHSFSNGQLVDRLEVSNFSYFRQVSFALSTITLCFAFLLTCTLLTVSVNQRLGEVAGLRALGFARRRVVADLVCEMALLVGAGGLLSLPLGALFAFMLDSILRDMPGLPARLHFFVFQPRALVLHVLLLATTGAVASLYPVYLTVRLPIAATLRKETVS
jgi:putative ABC transport system permease protein